MQRLERHATYLYNPQSQPFDLYEAHASLDSGPNTHPYYLHFGAAISAHGFLVVFPYNDAYFTGTQTPLLRLVIPDTVIDQVTMPTLLRDQSYARTTDGGNGWQITDTPTIDASNNPAQNGTQSTPTSNKHHRAKGRGRGHTTAENHSGGNPQTPQISGMQPDGSTLHLPGTATPTPGAPAGAPPPQPATTTTADIPRTVGLGALGVSLVLSLVWCWRLFIRKGV